MIIKGKKAFLEMTTELAFAIILMTILFVALLFVSYNRSLHVHALIEADKAQFACRNNLIMLMNFKYDNTQNYEHKLVLSYAKGDYTDFEVKLDNLMENFLKNDSWNLKLEDINQTKLFGREDIELMDNEALINCSILLPIPCTPDIENCLLNIAMENKYEKQ